MNAVLRTIHARSSLRVYKDRPISPEHRKTLLEATLRAPTAGNMMLYSIVTVTERSVKERLSVTCDNQPFIARAPLILLFLADYQRWFDYYRQSGVPEFCAAAGRSWQGPRLGDLFIAVNDAIIAAQTAVIAAESLGIGSCYIGDIMENYEVHRELLNLPDFAFPITMLCLGYYPDDYRPKYRGRFAEGFIVHDEQYERLNTERLAAMFAPLEKGFVATNGHGAENMGQLMYARKRGSTFAKEMTRSIGEALKNWQGEGGGSDE